MTQPGLLRAHAALRTPRSGWPFIPQVVVHGVRVVAAVSWSVIGAQLVLVVLLWNGARARWWAFALGSGFHVGIMFLMSLAVFGLAMIGVLAIVCLPSRRVGESVGIGNDQEVRAAAVRG